MLCYLGVLLCLRLVTAVQPQTQDPTIENLTTNHCAVLASLPENLSCAPYQARDQGGSVCLSRSSLCDGAADCSGAEDEGDPAVLNSLECNFAGTFVVLKNLAS